MVRSQWHKLKEQHSLGNVASRTFLTLFCSCVFENLLQECHKVMQKFKKSADVQKDPSFACKLESNLLWQLPLLVFLRSGVPITITHNSHAALRALSSDMLPHQVLRTGAVKRATSYSGFTQHQSVLSEVLI